MEAWAYLACSARDSNRSGGFWLYSCYRCRNPSSGDGRFIALHPHSVGVERDPVSVAEAAGRAPHATVVEADSFTWAAGDKRRFDCAAGNPPFIRYQRFTGATRRAALDYCGRLG